MAASGGNRLDQRVGGEITRPGRAGVGHPCGRKRAETSSPDCRSGNHGRHLECAGGNEAINGENSRGDRERTPVEYYGTLVSAESFDGATISIQVRDISADGIGILHHGPLPGRRVTVIFGDGSWSQTRRGLVRWTRRLAENVFASGISFHEFR